MNVIELKNIVKTYDMGGAEEVHALRSVSLSIGKNEYVAIMGPSGSGKSTLMNIIGCLDTPTSGLYEFNGVNVSEMDDNDLAKIRNKEIGFVFQTFNLLSRSDSLHNVELPLIYAGVPATERKRRAKGNAGARPARRQDSSQAERALRRATPAGGRGASARHQAIHHSRG